MMMIMMMTIDDVMMACVPRLHRALQSEKRQGMYLLAVMYRGLACRKADGACILQGFGVGGWPGGWPSVGCVALLAEV